MLTITRALSCMRIDWDWAATVSSAELFANDTYPNSDTLTIAAVSGISNRVAAVTRNADRTITVDAPSRPREPSVTGQLTPSSAIQARREDARQVWRGRGKMAFWRNIDRTKKYCGHISPRFRQHGTTAPDRHQILAENPGIVR